MAGHDAFTEYVDARSPRLLRMAYLLTRDWALAEDLLQTTLTKVWLHWNRIHHDVDGYTHQTMVNTYTSWWRRKWRGEVPTEEMPDPTPSDTGDEHIADRADLWNAVGRLPPRQRVVLVLRFFLDLSESDTARVMACARGTVKSQTSKALATLRVDPDFQSEREPRQASAATRGEPQ